MKSWKKSHRERRRRRVVLHPGRARRMWQDTHARQEIARLRGLYLQTDDPVYLNQAAILEDELNRSWPMPPRMVAA